jgi:hypothetical protein
MKPEGKWRRRRPENMIRTYLDFFVLFGRGREPSFEAAFPPSLWFLESLLFQPNGVPSTLENVTVEIGKGPGEEGQSLRSTP